MTGTHPLAPSVVDDLQRLTRTELSTRSRIRHVLLALVASAMTIVIASLWLTEPTLPPRAHVAFALLVAIGCGWTAFSAWVLSAKRVMLATHRVVAGRLAVTFTGAFAAGCVLLVLISDVRAAWPAAAMSLTLLAVALMLWRRAETGRAELLARRELLQQQIDRAR
jgi:hypothetical protein